MSKKLSILTILVGILVAINVYFAFDISREEQVGSGRAAIFNSTQAYVLPLAEPNYYPILNANLERPAVSAKSAAVYDVQSGKFLFAKDTRMRLPIASLTKLMGAVIITENLDLDNVVTISKTVLKIDGEKQDLYENEKITVDNLLKMMLIQSSNDAAYALAEFSKEKGFDFVSAMNDKAAALGLFSTNFLDPAGLNDESYSTVEDLIKIVRYSLRYDKLWNLMSEKELTVRSEDGAIEHQLKNTNQLLGEIPNIIGGKTGYTENALGCMILVVKVPGENDSLIVVTLNSNDRFADTQKLINWVGAAYRWR